MSTRGADGRWLTVQLSEGYVQAVGMESKTLIEASTITLSDSDSDGVTDTFTCTTVALTTETNTDNIAVYFSTADRLDNEGATDAWRIEPVTITINPGGTVTVRGRSWLVVKPISYEGVGNTHGVFSPIDPTVALNYVSTVSIYRRRTDGDGITTATSQAKLIWETFPFPNWGGCCGGTTMSYTGSSTDPASIAEAVARCGIRNSILGEVNPADSTYDATNLQWNSISWGICKPPDKVTVRYFSGFPLTDRQMNKQYQTIVARLAAAELAERICACDIANRELFKWQFDHALASGMANERYNVSQNDLDNPIGTKSGHIYAWKNINLLRQSIGIPL
jgi:hypothetical protein